MEGGLGGGQSLKTDVQSIKRAKRLCEVSEELEALICGWDVESLKVGDLVAGREGGERRYVKEKAVMKQAET